MAAKRAPDAPFAHVWTLIRRIPRGKVTTYGQLSELVERRLTPVGIGGAIRAAPAGSIPWHRVVDGRGGLHGSWPPVSSARCSRPKA